MAETTQVDPMEALKVIIQQLTEQQGDKFLDAIRELKKPSEREQRKLDEEDRRIARAQKERIELATAEIEAKAHNARGCGHVRTHPGTGVTKHLWRAQVHSPNGVQPYFVPTCQGCHTQIGKIPATMDMIRDGVNLDQYPMLTTEVLTKWAEQYKA